MKKRITTKWQVALDVVTREIESGVFPPGSTFYTIQQLCERFQFSNITAARVFDELKTRGMLRTNGRQGATVMLGFKTETVYLALRPEEVTAAGGTSRFFCAVMEGFRRPPFDRLFQITPVALDFCLAHPESFIDAPMIVLQDALFEVTANGAKIDSRLADVVRRKFDPIVFQVCVSIPGFTEVGIDMRSAIAEMVLLLHQQGHRRIAFLSGNVSALWLRTRFRGFLDALEAADLSFDPALLGITSGVDASEDEASITRILALPDPPTAIVCANDTRALNVLASCRQRGIRVPEDLAVTGFGDFLEAALSLPPLTTHDPHDADMGATVLDLLQKRREGRLKEPTSVMIRPKLIKRASHGQRKHLP